MLWGDANTTTGLKLSGDISDRASKVVRNESSRRHVDSYQSSSSGGVVCPKQKHIFGNV